MSAVAQKDNPTAPQKKPSKKVDIPNVAKVEADIARKIGKSTAKEFVHLNMVFPMKKDIVIDPYELSMSSLMKKRIHHTSYLNEEKYFNPFFVNYIAYWFKCCNEIRGDILSNSKDCYFSKCSRCEMN